MRTEVLTYLQNNADEKYRQFSLKLLPKDTKLLGVRIPLLRQYAKTLLKEGRAQLYLNIPLQDLKYQEEFMLHALILANAKMPSQDKIALIKKFIPHINTWAVCDIFCADLKEVKQNRDLFYETFKPLLTSHQEYQIRFFYVLALSYFITPEYLAKIFQHIKTQTYTGYYDKMAVAWLISIAYIKFLKETEAFLLNTPLDEFIFRKSISKICDSFRIKKETKVRLKTLASVRKTNKA
ncbi:MAG: DNA alkylation repair protein [Alphaproteobacteria bacterium]|nr:DNA alkylation repair protein [Alphaproteobacteria bacterium]